MNLALTELLEELQRKGLEAGLSVLNQRVPHRFTAVFKFDGAMMRNVAIIDKLGEVVPESIKVIPFENSFCQFVLRDGSFTTHDSAVDDRLQGHVYKGVLNTYVGLPISKNNGELFGTLCHFDFAPLDLPESEFQFLNQAVKVLPPYVKS
ncbi:GAF domain-containing protein [Polaromonas sp.]|uniref:GAF domain-containing protein n=1 Tax=Polaromonas sp. TaxID=1869339 RepID=UPI0017C3ED9D|nr:GAF domain-containing protein [Polaromonas sp.]NML85602.1 GAF domain-containing protein [Polaromonas sp.]